MKSVKLDDTITIPDQGKVFAIKGDNAATSTMLLSIAERQRKNNVLYIDANHCFNQLFVKKHYHKKELDLKGIYIARPFTLDQFKSIIQNLKSTIVEHKAKTIIISGFDKFIKKADSLLEKRYLAEQLMQEVNEQTKRHDCVTFISISKASIVEEIILDQVQLCTKV